MDAEMATSMSTWGPIIIMILIFYFLLYRPQKTEQKRRKDMLDSLKCGDKVLTVGGIYGKVAKIKDNVLSLQVADNMRIDVARSSINAIINEEKTSDSE